MRNLLFVSDNQDDLELYAAGLTSEGFHVDAVRAPDDGVLTGGPSDYHVAVVSASLTHEGGWRLCNLLRSSLPRTPMILLTASVRADEGNRRRAFRDGFAAFAGKPCPPALLADIAQRVIAGERGIESVGTGEPGVPSATLPRPPGP